MNTGLAIHIGDNGRQTTGHVDMPTLEAQMLSHLLNGDTRRAILTYHDEMVVDMAEARAVTKVLASVHGVRFRRV